MTLFNHKRVIYKKNPLVRVVCQLRFPRILVINDKEPVNFQEKIRETFPNYQRIVEEQHLIKLNYVPNDSLSTLSNAQSQLINNYHFSSLDGNWHINLTSSFLALSTSSYKRWEDFITKIIEPLEALKEIYKPAIFERVGLRYIDAFKKSFLDSIDTDWSNLIEPFALGFMSAPAFKNEVSTLQTLVDLNIDDKTKAKIRLGKGFYNDINDWPPLSELNESYIVDSDIYAVQKQLHEINNCFYYLHDYTTKILRSVISDKLHNAMEPQEI
ncbi:MAG: TIGR04255 family protein [Deltaproteobacteria bacterium]|jgi:uncharacterized protein (TIGR04255 family)|nr:TIGR04255 family protein [Deltaproteobacteria bacterium]